MQNSTFVRTSQKKTQKRFKIISKRFEEGVSFRSYIVPIASYVNEKLKNSPKQSENVIFLKVSISTLVQPQGNVELKFERNLLNRF